MHNDTGNSPIKTMRSHVPFFPNLINAGAPENSKEMAQSNSSCRSPACKFHFSLKYTAIFSWWNYKRRISDPYLLELVEIESKLCLYSFPVSAVLIWGNNLFKKQSQAIQLHLGTCNGPQRSLCQATLFLFFLTRFRHFDMKIPHQQLLCVMQSSTSWLRKIVPQMALWISAITFDLEGGQTQ